MASNRCPHSSSEKHVLGNQEYDCYQSPRTAHRSRRPFGQLGGFICASLLDPEPPTFSQFFVELPEVFPSQPDTNDTTVATSVKASPRSSSHTLSESSKGKPTILQQCGPDTGHRRRNPTEPFLDPLLRRCVSQQPRCITGISEGPPGHLTLGRSRRRDAPAPRRVGGGRAYRDPLLVPKNM